MMRSFTLLCAVMAGLSGLFLYSKKHQTTLLDQRISEIVADTQHVREQTAMLRAEWALLNQPDRLAALSARFLPDIHPMAPTQFIQMASLADRLPAPGARPLPLVNPRDAIGATLAPPPAHAPAEPAPAAPQHETPAPAILAAATHRQPPESAQPAQPAQPPARPVLLASATIPVAPTAPIRPATPRFVHPAALSPELPPNAGRRAVQSVAHAARAVLPPAANPATRIAAYHPPRPAPMAVAAWRPAAPVPYQEARGYGRGSSLGFSHSGTLPPPVPLSN